MRQSVLYECWMIEDSWLTVEGDVGLAFAFLPVGTLLELILARACRCSDSTAGEHDGEKSGFGVHGEE